DREDVQEGRQGSVGLERRTLRGQGREEADQPHADQGPQGCRVEGQSRIPRQERQERQGSRAQAERAEEGL
ncbi:MAG: hypothetical protein AVDCRST_MAG09-582, partial [uncultured Sphingomonas sp.]